MFTVTQTARVARRIIPKMTQEGIIPPRRRTSVRVPRISIIICCTEANQFARGASRCALIRSSIQLEFAASLTSHLPILGRSESAQLVLPLHANCGKGEGLRIDGLPSPHGPE